MESGTSATGSESIMAAWARPRVVERYTGYTPSFDVKAAVEKMVATVPSKFLVGLEEVVLTNTADLPRRVRRAVTKSRRKKVRMIEARGLYHPAWKNRPAWIEIFVDNTLRAWERGWWLKFPWYREILIGDVLFHEMGHHIHFSVRPEHREKEDVADAWKVRLSRNYSRKARPLLRAILKTLRFLSGPLFMLLMRKSARVELEKGLISRAEFEEREQEWKPL
jgi:hypothetical protein